MEREGSSPCSQGPATVLYPEPDESNQQPPTYFPNFILILSSHLRPGILIGLLSSDLFFNQNTVCNSHLSHACYMSRPSHTPWFDSPNNIWQSVEVRKLLITQFSPVQRK